ncbi:hypothetical protein, partial [Ochrobactrum sp. EDr1-4]|uniref:hypothetical protein n=1 Tax=Ochrobactrum sp. EDr1-4 TaxID=3368622 RepID=UPI003B9F3879
MYSTAKGNNSIAIGSNAVSQLDNNVVIGANSTDKAATIIDNVTINSKTYQFAGVSKAGDGTFSVGSAGKERQIVNVAAGEVSKKSTDAVNGSQLFSVTSAVDSLGESAVKVFGGNAAVGADGRISMSNVGGTGKNNVNDAIEHVNQTANAGWNVKDGAGHSANVGANGNVTFKGDRNVTVKQSGTDNNGKIDVALNKDIDLGKDGSVTTGKTSVSDAGVQVGKDVKLTDKGLELEGGVKVTTDGINAGNKKLTGIASGEVSATSKDAVNGSQLFSVTSAVDSLGESAVKVFGGNAAVGADGRISMSNVGGTGKNNVNDAIEHVNQTANAGWNVKDGAGHSANVGANGNVTFKGDRNVTVKQSGTDNNGKIDVALNKDIDLGKDGSVTTGKTSVSDAGVQVGKDVKLTDKGLELEGGVKVTTDGINAGNKKLTGIASGEVSATSKDAVNGSQLFSVTSAVDSLGESAVKVFGGNAAVGADGRISMSNVGGTGKNNVNDAIEHVNQTANAGWNVKDGAGHSANVGANGNVTFKGDRNVTVKQSGTDNNGAIDVALNKDIDLGKDGSVATGKTSVSDAGVQVGKDVKLTDKGLELEGGVKVTTDGINAGNKKLTGIADGEVSATSKDAVNGSQLFSVTSAVDSLGESAVKVFGGNAAVGADGRISMSNVGGTGKNNVNDAIEHVNQTANAGWNVKDGAGHSANVGATGNVTFKGDRNVTVKQSGTDNNGAIDVALNKDIDLGKDGSVATGKTSVSDAGVQVGKDVKITDKGLEFKGGVKVTTDGINAGNKKLTGIASGLVADGSLDAINGDQLSGVSKSVTTVLGGNAAVGADGRISMSNVGGTGKNNVNDAIEHVNQTANAGWNVKDGAGHSANVGANGNVTFKGDRNVTVKQSGTDNNGAIDVALNKDIDLGKDGSVATGKTSVSDAGVQVGKDVKLTDKGLELEGGVKVTTDGINAGNKKLTGIASGLVADGSLDAINGGQLSGVSKSVTTVLGGNAAVGADGRISMSNVGGTGKNNVNDAIEHVNQTANAGWNVKDGAGHSANVGANGNVTFKGDRNVTVKQSGTDNNGAIDVALNKDIDVGKDGSVTTGKTSVSDAGVQVGKDVKLTDKGLELEGGVKVTTDGINAGNKKLTGIAGGLVADGSLDAINGGQLFGVSRSVTTVLGGNAAVGADGRISMSNV